MSSTFLESIKKDIVALSNKDKVTNYVFCTDFAIYKGIKFSTTKDDLLIELIGTYDIDIQKNKTKYKDITEEFKKLGLEFSLSEVIKLIKAKYKSDARENKLALKLMYLKKYINLNMYPRRTLLITKHKGRGNGYFKSN